MRRFVIFSLLSALTIFSVLILSAGLLTIPVSSVFSNVMFYLLFPDLERRSAFIREMKARDVQCVFHYLALHSSAFYSPRHDGRALPNCDNYADCLVRLPLFYELDPQIVISAAKEVLGI